MRLLTLVPSAHLTAWTAVADTERAQQAHPAALARDGHTCRFCGFHAQVRQGVVHLDGNRANPALDNLATACLLCDAVQDLGRPTTVQEMLLVWLPEMSQAVLNGLVRGIHQVLHGLRASHNCGTKCHVPALEEGVETAETPGDGFRAGWLVAA